METCRQRGYSLVELLIVVSLLTLTAAIIAPSLPAEDKLTPVANEVRRAIAFAHAEAKRTGEAYGVNVSVSNQTLRIYRLDESGWFPSAEYDIRDPYSKQLYTMTLGDAVTISDSEFRFDGISSSQSFLGFAANTGIPKYTSFGTTRLLDTAFIELSDGTQTQTVRISPMTGRVTID